MADTGDLIEVRRGDRAIRFRPCGGRIEAHLRRNEFYEQPMLDYIEALALPGLYADIGAYVGTHAIFFAAFCPASRVLAFEPRPRILEHLRHNVDVNQLGDRIEVHPFGLSDQNESVRMKLDGERISLDCRPLDEVVAEPVALMKLDVEGMEARVLAGAAGLLERSRPLLFAEAQDDAALADLLRPLAPYGYQPTGRIFNTTATHELAAPGSPTVPLDRLPAVQSLLQPDWWVADDPALSVEVTPGRLRVDSALAAEKLAHVTWRPAKTAKPPSDVTVVLTPGAPTFLQATGHATPGMAIWIYLLEYRGAERTQVRRHWFSPRLFQRVALRPDTERIRIALRFSGPGQLELDRLAIHTIAPH